MRGTCQGNNFYQFVFFIRTGLVLKSNTSLKNITGTALHHTISNTQSRENDRAKTISLTVLRPVIRYDSAYTSDTWSCDSAPSTTSRAVTLR
jgi:hypothetical protein